MKLLTFNIAHGRGMSAPFGGMLEYLNNVATKFELDSVKENRLKKIADIASHADIAFLNEINQSQVKYIAEHAGFTSFIYVENFNIILDSWGNAILSRYPIIRHDVLALEPVGVGGQKNGIFVQIQPPKGPPLFIVGVHLNVDPQIRAISLAKLYKELRVRGIPVKQTVIMGDVNQPITFHGMKTIQELSYPSHNPGQMLDGIFVPDHFAIINRQSIKEPKVSDHLPILVQLESAYPLDMYED